MNLFDVLDETADEAVAGRRLDPVAILERAERPEYRPVLRPVVGHGAPRWRPRRGLPRHPVARGLLVAAAAAAAVVLVLAALPAAQRALPQPADLPRGQAGVPRTLFTAPQWTPSVVGRPISRAVYVAVAAPPTHEAGQPGGLRTPPAAPWLVGADGGEYRTLPVAAGAGEIGSVALSPDGARVGWISDGRYGLRTRLDVVEVRTGALRTVELTGSGRRGFAVAGLAFAPDGRHLALWGRDVVAGTSVVRLTVLDVVTGTTTPLAAGSAGAGSPSCTLTGADADGAFLSAGWDPGSPATLLTRGCPAGGAATTTLPVEGAPVTVTGTLPGPAPDAVAPIGLSVPQGVDGAAAVVDGAGARYSVTQPVPGGTGDVVHALVGTTPDGASRQVADLGRQAGAAVLTADPRGVVVSRWRTGSADGTGIFGPAEVLRVDPAGTVTTLTSTSGDQARVVAAARDLLASGRPVDGAAPGARVLDGAWWSWASAGLLDRLPLPSASTWGVLLSIGLTFALAWGLGRLGLRFVRPDARRRRTLVRWAGVVAAFGIVVALQSVPRDAPRAAAPAGVSGPVVPRTVGDQRLVPPRAFDAVGRPRTTAVGVVFFGTVAGRPGLYATDAATGQLVRLDDLPGLGQIVGDGWPANVTVSPGGRWLFDGRMLVDLAGARLTDVGGGRDVTGQTDRVASNAAVLDDGSVAFAEGRSKELWFLRRPGTAAEQGGRVPGVRGVFAVSGAGPDRVVVRVEGAAVKEGEPMTLLVDVGSPGSGASLDRPRVTPLAVAQNRLAAVLGRSAVPGEGPAGLFVAEVGTTTGPQTGRAGARIPTAGGVDALWLADTGPDGAARSAVVVGAGRTADLVVSRVAIGPPGAAGSGAVTELVRFDPAVLQGPGGRLSGAPDVVTVAAEVLGTATAVDPPAVDRWWSAVPRLP